MRFRAYLLAATGLAALGSVEAQAGAFGLREQSAIGLGQAFAGAASGSAGVSSMYWNPATITMNPGWTSEVNVTYIDPEAQLRVRPPTPTLALGQAGDIGLSGVVPASYSTYQLTENLWIGLESVAPFGLVTKSPNRWAGQTYSRSSRVFSAAFSPIIGYKVNEMFSIAVGPTIEYFKTRLTSALTPGLVSPSGILEGDDVSAGWTAGATLTPMQGTVLGVGFRSSINHQLKGTFRIFSPAGTPLVFPAKVNLNMPEQLNFGITQNITDDFKLSLGFEWTNWSRLKTPGVVLDPTGAPLTVVPLGYKDGYYFSVGGEYAINQQWTVRAGIGYELSPIDRSNRGTRLPDTDRLHVNIGASYKWSEKLELSLSYAHLFGIGNRQIRLVPGNVAYNALPLFGDVRANVNIVGVSLKYRWDDPRVAQAAPIIRKY